MAGHRCTKIEAEARHSWIVDQIAAFRPRPEIVREVMERYGVSRPQALKYMQRADAERYQVYDSVERMDLLTTALQAAEKAVELAIARKNPNEIIGAVRLLDNLVHFGIGWESNHRRSTGHRPWENR
jgi:hypothetical protein